MYPQIIIAGITAGSTIIAAVLKYLSDREERELKREELEKKSFVNKSSDTIADKEREKYYKLKYQNEEMRNKILQAELDKITE